MTDLLTCTTERQVLGECTRIFGEKAAAEQYNYVPPREVIRFNFDALAQIIGAKYARLVARRTGFAPDDHGYWYRSYPRGDGAGMLNLDSIEAGMRDAVTDLDPCGLLAPLMKGRAEWA